MEIVDVDVEVVQIGRSFGVTSAVKEIDASTFAFVRLTADDGTTGIGEISDIEHPESMPDSTEIEAEIGHFLLGEDPREINRLTVEMYDAIALGLFDFHSFQQLTLAAVDTALYDLVGNTYDVPAYQLLGGRTQDVTACWVVFTNQDPNMLESLREEVGTRVAEGFSAFKLKVGEIDPEVDAERIRAVREIAGDDAQIFVDAQGVWELEEAIENIRYFESVGIDGVETPVGSPDTDVETSGYYYDVPLVPSELSTVRKAVDTPIFEHVLDPEFGIDLVVEDAVDLFTVEVCSGGISRANRILSIAESAGIDARLGSTVELGPGTLAAGALGTASTAVTYPCDLIGPLVYDDSMLETSVEYDDGRFRPSDEPGFDCSLRPNVFD